MPHLAAGNSACRALQPRPAGGPAAPRRRLLAGLPQLEIFASSASGKVYSYVKHTKKNSTHTNYGTIDRSVLLTVSAPAAGPAALQVAPAMASINLLLLGAPVRCRAVLHRARQSAGGNGWMHDA